MSAPRVPVGSVWRRRGAPRQYEVVGAHDRMVTAVGDGVLAALCACGVDLLWPDDSEHTLSAFVDAFERIA